MKGMCLCKVLRSSHLVAAIVQLTQGLVVVPISSFKAANVAKSMCPLGLSNEDWPQRAGRCLAPQVSAAAAVCARRNQELVHGGTGLVNECVSSK